MRVVRFTVPVAITVACLGFILAPGELLTPAGTVARACPGRRVPGGDDGADRRRAVAQPAGARPADAPAGHGAVSRARRERRGHQDFEIHWAKGTASPMSPARAPVTPTRCSRRRRSASRSPRWPCSARCRTGRLSLDAGHQHDSEIVEAAGRRVHARPAGHAARA